MGERQGMGNGATVAPEPPPALVLPTAERLHGSLHGSEQPAFWDELCRTARSDARRDLATLVRRQELVANDRVKTNGFVSHRDDGRHALLTALVEGRPNLQPFAPEFLPLRDQDFDLHQREAVSRALSTPDICLIAGPRGSGKTRVLVEILTQAASRGERILFLSRRTAGVDEVLAHLVGRDGLFPVRCVEPGERPMLLPAAVRPLVMAERIRQLEDALPLALRSKERALERCRLRRQEEPIWLPLRSTAETVALLVARQNEIREQIARIADQVRRTLTEHAADAAADFVQLVRDEEKRHRDNLADVDAALIRINAMQADGKHQIGALEVASRELDVFLEARQSRRFWSPVWWRALLTRNLHKRREELEAQRQAICSSLDSAAEEIECLGQKRQRLEEEHRASVDQLVTREIHVRQEKWLEEQANLQQQIEALETKWLDMLSRLKVQTVRPGAITAEAVDKAHLQWQHVLREDEETSRLAGQWADFLQDILRALPQRLPALVNVVAATPAALAADKHFSRGADFDLLVVHDADQFNEAEFLRAAQRARRWVLIGKPDTTMPPVPAAGKLPDPHREQIPAGRRRVAAIAQSRVGPVPLFHTLCRQHRNALDLQPAYSPWCYEDGKLCCRLRTVDCSQRDWLETERVVDSPDVELRILAFPKDEPEIAEVLFPASTQFADAKQFIYRELEELPLDTAGATFCLLEDAGRVVVCLGSSDAEVNDHDPVVVDMGHGVRELIRKCSDRPVGWQTCRLEFDKAAGWKREGVQKWLQRHWHLRDSGRFISLDSTAY